MKVYNFRLRAKVNPQFCGALDRGKCCFKKNEVNGFCNLHNEIFQLLANGEEITPESSFRVDYQPHIIAHSSRCIIIEINGSNKDEFHICKTPPFQEGLCERHYRILSLLGVLAEFKKSKIFDDIGFNENNMNQ